MASDYEMTQYLGYLSAGADVKVSKNISAGLMAKYYAVLSSSQNANINNYTFYNPYTPYGSMVNQSPEKQYVGGTLQNANYYTIMGDVRLHILMGIEIRAEGIADPDFMTLSLRSFELVRATVRGYDSRMATQNSFALNDLTSQMGGTKIWTLVFDTPGEKVNKLLPRRDPGIQSAPRSARVHGKRRADRRTGPGLGQARQFHCRRGHPDVRGGENRGGGAGAFAARGRSC